MNIIEALKEDNALVVSNKKRWLFWDHWKNEWVVKEKHRGSVETITRTADETEAIKALLDE